MTYQRSQSRSPSLILACNTVSASGHLPSNPPATWPDSGSPPPIPPPPLNSIPPSRYLGQSTSLIFSHTALRSLDNVSQTDSSIVLVGARRSSPGMADVKYDERF